MASEGKWSNDYLLKEDHLKELTEVVKVIIHDN